MLFSLLSVVILAHLALVLSFDVYWNVPSIVCKTNYDIFINMSEFGFLQSEGDEFYGDQVVLMYDTGEFPYFDNRTGEPNAVNGGIPQLGNMSIHLQDLRAVIDYRIPDVNFSGIAVLDMEYWRPIYRQNFASSNSLRIYQEKSKELEMQLHPEWTSQQIEKEAERRFELYARLFMEKTIELGREMRPYAIWGYYIFPMCFNGATNETQNCPDIVKKENDELKWLYDASDAMFPSIYLGIENQEWHFEFIYNRVEEAKRVSENMNTDKNEDTCPRGKPRAPDVFPYTWYRYYEEEKYLYVEDILNSFGIPRFLEARGVVIWGSTGDLSSREKCERFHYYVKYTLGPVVQHIRKVHMARLEDLLDGKCTLAVADGAVRDNCEIISNYSLGSTCIVNIFTLLSLLIIVKYFT